MTAHSSSGAITASRINLFVSLTAGVCILTASSYFSVPMYPVPVTMQTLAVIMVGALAGPRLGAAMVVSWLSVSLLGAPVLAGGSNGLAAFAGPTAGYLAAFPIAAFAAGYVARVKHPAAQFAGFVALHALILAMGWAWLSSFVGAQIALTAGVTPFIIGALIKSGLAASLLVVLAKRP